MKGFFCLLIICFHQLVALDVLVTLPPFAYFVERIGGDLVTVQSLIPSGASPHTYEPTPREVRQAIASQVWFRIGEPLEDRVVPALQHVDIVDLREGINLIAGCPHCGEDLHFWLSPKEAQIFSRTIANALIKKMPGKQVRIENNLNKLLGELRSLDQTLSQKLMPCVGGAIIVSHPSFAYFCRDYHLKELPIEFEGKEPSPRQLSNLLREAKRRAVEVVILQPQFNPQGAKRVAEELNLRTCTINPLAPNPIKTMRKLARCICQQ